MTQHSDADTEFSFLGYLLLNQKQISQYLDVNPELFTESFSAETFAKMKELFLENVSFTHTSLAKLLSGDKAFNAKVLINMAKAATGITYEQDFEELKTLYRKRKLKEKLDMAADSLDNNATADEAIQDILDFMADVEIGKDRLKVKQTEEVFSSILEEMKRPIPPLKSGLAGLDRILQGGFIKGKSYSISARKKVGKTAMLGQIGVSLATMGQRVLYIALEMGSSQIMHRMLARPMAVNPMAFVTEQSSTKEFGEKFAKAAKAFPKGLKFIDGAGMSFDELKALLTREKNRIDCFVLDYWQLVGGKQKNKSTSEHLDEIAQWLSDYARRNNILNITATQLNQEDNTRGSEGIRLAYDLTLIMHKTEHAVTEERKGYGRWLEMTDTRYTPFLDAGDDLEPAIYLNPQGVFFYDADMEANKQVA